MLRNARRPIKVLLAFILFSLMNSVVLAQRQKKAPNFHPEKWHTEDLNRYLALQNQLDRRSMRELAKSAVGSKAMIAGTSEPFAIHAGMEVLKHGGNAADAALATSLAQIALTAGAAVSYAGIMTAVYYDAGSKRVFTLDAGYNTVRNEKDP
jgi:gamma-glutamyltranspeptidase / glutathione hydrolase